MGTPNFGKVEILLLHLAYKRKEGVSISNVIVSAGVSIAQAASGFRKLKALGLLRSSDGLLQLTDDGRKWLFDNQALFKYSGEKPWRQVPDRFNADRIGPFVPYVPRTSKLSKQMFELGD